MDYDPFLLLFELTNDEGYRSGSDKELYQPASRVGNGDGQADLHKEGVDDHQRHNGSDPDGQSQQGAYAKRE